MPSGPVPRRRSLGTVCGAHIANGGHFGAQVRSRARRSLRSCSTRSWKGSEDEIRGNARGLLAGLTCVQHRSGRGRCPARAPGVNVFDPMPDVETFIAAKRCRQPLPGRQRPLSGLHRHNHHARPRAILCHRHRERPSEVVCNNAAQAGQLDRGRSPTYPHLQQALRRRSLRHGRSGRRARLSLPVRRPWPAGHSASGACLLLRQPAQGAQGQQPDDLHRCQCGGEDGGVV